MVFMVIRIEFFFPFSDTRLLEFYDGISRCVHLEGFRTLFEPMVLIINSQSNVLNQQLEIIATSFRCNHLATPTIIRAMHWWKFSSDFQNLLSCNLDWFCTWIASMKSGIPFNTLDKLNKRLDRIKKYSTDFVGKNETAEKTFCRFQPQISAKLENSLSNFPFFR